LGVFLLIGVFFEMLGLGILIPAFAIILNPKVGDEFPLIKPLVELLGNPTHFQLLFFGMSILIFTYFLKAIFLIFLSWRQSKFSADLSANIGKKLFDGYLRMPYTFHLQRNSAELLRNIQGEVGQFTFISQSVISLSVEISVISGVVFTIILLEPMGAFIIMLFLGISIFVFHRMTKNRLLNWGNLRQLHSGLSNKHVLQGIGGIKDVKFLGKEKYFLNQFDFHNEQNAKTLAKVATLGLIPRSYLELLSVFGLAGLIIIMVFQNKPVELLIPTIGVFAAAAFRMIPSANRIMTSMQGIRYAQPVVELLYNEFKIINEADKTDSLKENLEELNFENELRLNHVNFKYFKSTRNALHDINLTIKRGETIGFIGPSGSGKSTLVDIILGLIVPNKGTISFDNQDILKNVRYWQNQIGYVPQTIYLTDDSIKNNIAFGIPEDKIDEIALQKAIDAAQLKEYIDSLPEGVLSYVGERGVRLSGGQRQRIGIARALYYNPQILLLDEATSALDSLTEIEVMKSITALKNEKTILIVAHRISTLTNCHKIYKLENGKIVEEGTPSTMLN
jgi:ABC-type multidrug transport system fused ATPase/permease subunit